MKLSLVLMLFAVKMCFSYHLSDRMRYWKNKFNDDAVANEEIASDEHAVPVVVFTSDWNENVEGELGVGCDLKIIYAGGRLPGEPRRIYAEYKFSEHGQVHSERLDENGNMFTETIFVPYDAKALIIWFRREDHYDSNYDNNYHFDIAKPSIVFDSSWGETVHGSLKAGEKFDVFYNSERLEGDKNITAEMKFSEEGSVSSEKLDVISGATSYLHEVVDIPNDAEKVIMWFYQEENGDRHYDSDYGQNYHFELTSS